jgi:hypothetical protein
VRWWKSPQSTLLALIFFVSKQLLNNNNIPEQKPQITAAMSSLFDFDCPRTPDGESTEEPWQQKKKIPPMAPSKPPRISRNSSRSMMKSSSTRSRSAPRRVGGGLDPEEYIAPTITRKSAAPSSGNGVISRPRAFSSSGMTGSDGLPRAPSSGPSRYVPTAPSSGPSVYTASPRVAPKSGAWNYMEGNHPRTNSSDWWKEEIVNETEGKGECQLVCRSCAAFLSVVRF